MYPLTVVTSHLTWGSVSRIFLLTLSASGCYGPPDECVCICVIACVCIYVIACVCASAHVYYLCNLIFHILKCSISIQISLFLIILLIKRKGIDTGIEYLNKCSH